MIQLKLYIIVHSSVSTYASGSIRRADSSQTGQCKSVITPLPLTTCMIVFLTPYYFVSTFQSGLFLNCQSGSAHPTHPARSALVCLS